MSLEQEQHWITAEEFRREWQRLRDRGASDDDPEYQRFVARVAARDGYLFEKYGKPLMEQHRGKWIAISLNGDVILRDTSGELAWAAREAFGPGNYAARKLDDFPGHRFEF